MPGTAGKKPVARRSATSRTRSTQPARRAGASGTKRVAAKKAAGGRSAPKKTSVKKTPAKKTARKSTAKRAASKRTGSKKTGSKKTGSKKTGPKKAAPKKAPAKKPSPTRLTAKRPSLTASVAGKKAATTKATAAVTAKAKPTFAPLPPPAGTPTKSRSGKKIVICPLSGFEVTPAPASLSPKTLDRLRQKLLDEKQRLRHQAEELTAEAEQLAREREAGDTQFDEESGEGDTVNIERERDLLLSATARQVVEEIDDALERIKRGKYGSCKPAGRKISLERLEAIPWAQVCVDCKARAERRR
jgi:RNA polymerase-binding protein DksA